MNLNERKMVEILLKGKEQHGYLGVKAEFEAEGTRIDELFRLMDIAGKANVQLTVKIGGCEAIRDLYESKQLGVDFIVAPMVETAYALKKFSLAIEKTYTQEERQEVDFLFNLETKTGYENRVDLVNLAVVSDIDGLVLGRNDFAGSYGLQASDIESDFITSKVMEIAEFCKDSKLDLVVGGAVSTTSIANLKRIKSVYLTRFETRKIIFGSDSLEIKNLEDGLLGAVQFELLWLKNKKDYYSRISNEDNLRFDTLKTRWGFLE